MKINGKMTEKEYSFGLSKKELYALEIIKVLIEKESSFLKIQSVFIDDKIDTLTDIAAMITNSLLRKLGS